MFTVRLLGQFSLALDDVPVELPSRPAQSLLAWLILHPDIAHRREQIAGLLWPDATEENARSNLRHALWRLRRVAPESYVHADKIAIRWPVSDDWWLDVAALVGAPPAPTRADDLLPAVALYAGELLPGFYDEWIGLERERLAALYEEKIARLLELLLAEQRWRETTDWAERWIAQGHTPEPAYRALMRAYASQGNSSAALTAYQRCVDALERELAVPPSPETSALADAIRNSQFPIHHSPLPTLHSPISAPPLSNLPAPTTPLIGRENELAALAELLTDSAHRLVTLLGPGGMGKSRLAVEVGHRLAPLFPDGVFLVELTPLAGPEAIPRAIGDAIGYSYPSDTRPLRRQIAHFLRDRRVLLLLDNFEHLLEGSALLVEMLQAAPGLRLLVTSRERLRLQAETLFRLHGLDYPAAGEAVSSDFPYAGAQLFLDHARRTRRTFTPDERAWPAILRICRLVDGMPLALILAAGWVELLHPSEIADEIAASVAFLGQDFTDLEPRHRTMQAVIAQSWQRLEETEKEALMTLSVFAGGFDRESAQAVSGATLHTLTRLVDKALLWRTGESRYDLHALICQFARQKLAERGEEETRRAKHSRWFLGLVSRREADLKGSGDSQAIEQMETEWENIAAGWRWAAEHGETAGMLAAVEALGIFHNRHGRWADGEALMSRASHALTHPVEPQARHLHLWLVAWRSLFLHRIGRVEQARQDFTGLLAQLKSEPLPPAEHQRLQAFALLYRGGELMTDRRRGETGEDLRRALALYEGLDDRWWMVQSLLLLGSWELFNGQLGQAWKRQSQAAQLAGKLGHRHSEATAFERMSFTAEHMGDTEAGEQLARDGLALESNPNRRTQLINRLTFALLAVGKFEESVALATEALHLKMRDGYTVRGLVFMENTLARGYLHLGRFVEARATATSALQEWLETYGWEHPYILRSLSRALLALGDAEESRKMVLRTVESQQQMGNENLFALSGAFVDSVYPALALHRQDEARRMLAEGLRLVQQCGAYHHTCLALPAAARLYAEEDKLEEAAFIHGAIQRYPCLLRSRWFARTALDELSQRLAALLPADRAPAEARGQALHLREMTDELLTLLA